MTNVNKYRKIVFPSGSLSSGVCCPSFHHCRPSGALRPWWVMHSSKCWLLHWTMGLSFSSGLSSNLMRGKNTCFMEWPLWLYLIISEKHLLQCLHTLSTQYSLGNITIIVVVIITLLLVSEKSTHFPLSFPTVGTKSVCSLMGENDACFNLRFLVTHPPTFFF